MDIKAINRVLKSLAPGDPVEVLWSDACTQTSGWKDIAEAKKLTLAMILTRGSFISLNEDTLTIALDMGVLDDGSVGDGHSFGLIPRGSIVDVAKLRRVGRKK